MSEKKTKVPLKTYLSGKTAHTKSILSVIRTKILTNFHSFNFYATFLQTKIMLKVACNKKESRKTFQTNTAETIS